MLQVTLRGNGLILETPVPRGDQVRIVRSGNLLSVGGSSEQHLANIEFIERVSSELSKRGKRIETVQPDLLFEVIRNVQDRMRFAEIEEEMRRVTAVGACPIHCDEEELMNVAVPILIPNERELHGHS